MIERVLDAVRWIENAQEEWLSRNGGCRADVQVIGVRYIGIASLDSDGDPVLSVYLIDEVEHAIRFAERLIASGEETSKMLAFGAGQADWVDKQIEEDELNNG